MYDTVVVDAFEEIMTRGNIGQTAFLLVGKKPNEGHQGAQGTVYSLLPYMQSVSGLPIIGLPTSMPGERRPKFFLGLEPIASADTLEGLAQAMGDYQRHNPTHPFTDAMRIYGVISFTLPDEELAANVGLDLGGYVGLAADEQQTLKASAGAGQSLREILQQAGEMRWGS